VIDRRTTSCILLLALASSASVLSASEAPLGVVDRDDPDATNAVGGGWMRINADWRFIETEDDVFNWESGYAVALLDAEAQGIRTSTVITTGQCWATGFPGGGAADFPSHAPIDLTTEPDPVFAYSRTYYDFVFTFVDHWRDRIDRITVENEVNTRVFWAGTMDEYRRVLATARKAAHDAAPEVLVFDSGLGSGSWGAACAQWMLESGEYTDAEVLAFANDYYEHDVYAPFSWSTIGALRFWLYQPSVQENNKRVDYILATVPTHTDGLNFKFTQSAWLLPHLVTWMDARAAEFGHVIDRKINNEASNWPRGSATAEARNLSRMLIQGFAHGVEQTLWFPLSNQTTDTPRRGLLDAAGDWTLQADAFLNIAERLDDDFVFAGHDLLGSAVHRFRFRRGSAPEPYLDVLWWDDGSHGTGSASATWTVPGDTDSVVVHDYLGNPSGQSVSGGSVTATISHSPRFFEYVGSILTAPAPPGAPAVVLTAHPSPFRATTRLAFDLLETSSVRLIVVDAAGRRVRTLIEATLPAGSHEIGWDGQDERSRPTPPGVYFARLETAHGPATRRLLRLE
jgi:hypothetical protein